MIDKKEIKEKICWYELNLTGYRKLNGGDVKVLNLKINRKEKRVYADIILIKEDDGSYNKERLDGCFYDFKSLGIEEDELTEIVREKVEKIKNEI